MAFLILFLLIALPIVELTVLVQVAGSIGVFDTLGLLILVSLVGVWLAKREGLSVVGRLRRAQTRGEVPSRELTDGSLILLAAFLLVLPGFVSDVAGILLLLPPVRIAVRTLLLRRFRSSARIVVVPGPAAGTRLDDVWDAESWEETPRRSRRELGGGP